MRNKLTVIILIFLLSISIFFFAIKNFFANRFAKLEKNQQLILEELKKIKNEEKISPTDTPFSTAQNLGKIKEELVKIKNQVDQQQEILGFNTLELSPTATPTPELSLLNFVSIADRRWQTVDVYSDKKSSSKIIGQAVYGKSYPYLKKEDNYYYIQLNENTYGWIHSQFVKEY